MVIDKQSKAVFDSLNFNSYDFYAVSIADAAPFTYITNHNSNNVSVIDTAKDVVTATVNVGACLGELQLRQMEQRYI